VKEMDNSSINDSGGIKSLQRILTGFAILVFLPCLASLININFAQDWKIHFFPAAIILSAVLFGAGGGIVAGIAGSLYSALLLGNPYILVGNALFGLLTGIFYKKTGSIIISVLLAFLCELPWLILSDYYLIHLPAAFIGRLVVVLFLANILWAALIHAGIKPLRKILC
jgi:membrane protease YdiL (CAAX protease family)